MVAAIAVTATHRPEPCFWDALDRSIARWTIRRLRSVVEMRVSNVDKHTNEDEIPVRMCNYVDVYYHDRINSDLPYMKVTVSYAEAERFRLKRNDVVITKDSETCGRHRGPSPSDGPTQRPNLRIPFSNPPTNPSH